MSRLVRDKYHGLPVHTKVHWRYRGAIGHGEIVGIETEGATRRRTEYRVREFDHHPGEKDILNHWGGVLRKD